MMIGKKQASFMQGFRCRKRRTFSPERIFLLNVFSASAEKNGERKKKSGGLGREKVIETGRKKTLGAAVHHPN